MSIATLGYVPYLRPGSLLFTLIAFRHLQSDRSKEKTLVDLYGTAGGRKRNLFGENVASVAERAFGGSVPPGDVLLKHTLFGVYSRALPPTVAAAWSDSLIVGSRRHNARTLLRTSSPRTFQLITKHLRSCHQCIAEDVALFGFGQWRVLHQIPSLFFCPAHGHPLCEEAKGDNAGNVWQYLLPCGKQFDRAYIPRWAASDGHATYLELWTDLFDGKLPVLSSHAWAAYMDLVRAKVGDLGSAQAAIETTIRRTWSADSASIKSMLGSQIKINFVHAELSHNSAPVRLAQKLIVLGAATALGILPPNADGDSQLRLDLGLSYEKTSATTPQAQLRAFLLDAGLPASLVPFLLTDQKISEIARAAGLHRGKIWRAIEKIPDQLLEEICDTREWSRRAWIKNEFQRRRDKRPSRIS